MNTDNWKPDALYFRNVRYISKELRDSLKTDYPVWFESRLGIHLMSVFLVQSKADLPSVMLQSYDHEYRRILQSLGITHNGLYYEGQCYRYEFKIDEGYVQRCSQDMASGDKKLMVNLLTGKSLNYRRYKAEMIRADREHKNRMITLLYQTAPKFYDPLFDAKVKEGDHVTWHLKFNPYPEWMSYNEDARIFADIQNLKKSVRREIWAGNYELDIKNCYFFVLCKILGLDQFSERFSGRDFLDWILLQTGEETERAGTPSNVSRESEDFEEDLALDDEPEGNEDLSENEQKNPETDISLDRPTLKKWLYAMCFGAGRTKLLETVGEQNHRLLMSIPEIADLHTAIKLKIKDLRHVNGLSYKEACSELAFLCQGIERNIMLAIYEQKDDIGFTPIVHLHDGCLFAVKDRSKEELILRRLVEAGNAALESEGIKTTIEVIKI